MNASVKPHLKVMKSEQIQSEKEALELKKLRQELLHGKITLYLSILGSVLLLIGLAVDRARSLAQRKTENDLRERELRLAIFSERKQAYLALTDAACALAACRNYQEVEKAGAEFTKLYYGRAHIISEGDPKVENAKIALHKALQKYLAEEPTDSPEDYFWSLAMDVTFACKPSIDPRTLK
jgi:hypothetical protein